MNKIISGLGCSLITLSLFAGCVSDYCRQPFRNKDGSINSGTSEAKALKNSETVKVFKYDGSLQCDLGQAISLEKMAEELKSIKILFQEKLHDGLMHITVCGSTTGYANVYTIKSEDFESAKELGFKHWKN